MYHYNIGSIEVNPLQKVAVEGQSVTFDCTIRKSNTRFTVEWTSDATNLMNDSFSYESSGAVTLPLSLMNVMKEDFQTYTCSGRDSDSNEIFVSASVVLSKLILLNITSYIVR